MLMKVSFLQLVLICSIFISGATLQAQTSTEDRAATQPATAPATQPAEEEEEVDHSFVGRDTLTDGWLGASRAMAEKGFSATLLLAQLYQQNLHGGLSTHRKAGVYSGRYDLDLDADMEKVAGIPGGRIYSQVRGGWSDGIDEPSVGSLGGVNSIAIGNEPIDVWQLYYEQAFFDRKLLVRAGKIDLTYGFTCKECPGSFDGSMYANYEITQFLYGGLANNLTIPFPDPGLGIGVHVEPVEWWYISAAVADAQARVNTTGFNTAFHGQDDFFSIYETGFTPELPSSKGPLQGIYRVGMWYDPQPKERFEGGTKRDDVGFYTSCDQMVWKENDTKDDQQGLGLFGRYGIADADVSEIKSFWSTGVQYQGLIPTRDNDVTGLGVAQSVLSRQADFSADNETALEWYYNIQLTGWLHITPDVQWIHNPGGDSSVDDAVVLGVRVVINF